MLSTGDETLRKPILFLLFVLLAIPAMAQQPTDPTVAGITALLEKHDTALKQHDVKIIGELFAAGPKTVLLGTGPGERWEGKDEIRSAYEHFMQDFDKGSLTPNCYWKSGGINGNTAWLGAMCKMSDSLKGKPREYELNVSAVLEKIDGKWLFRQMHFSNLTPGEPK